MCDTSNLIDISDEEQAWLMTAGLFALRSVRRTFFAKDFSLRIWLCRLNDTDFEIRVNPHG